MLTQLKKLTLSILINGFLVVALILTIQNSNSKTKVDLLFFKTILLPVSFITGMSFLSGSFLGSILPFCIPSNKKEDLKGN